MTRHLSALAAILPVAVLLSAGACGGGGGSGDVIDRETFVSTYVDLRLAALRDADLEVTDEQRSEILGSHGVDEESLIRFADAHGDDIDFMSDVWTDVDQRIQAKQAEQADTGSVSGSRSGA